MTSFLPLKVQGFDFERNSAEINNVCICCTSQNDITTKFSSCKHTRFLTNYIKPEIDLKNTYICNICHEMLKIIELFMHQVEGSILSLLEKIPIHKPHLVTIVGEPTPTDIDDVKSEIDIASVKSEATDEECLQVEQLENDIELEQVENDIKLEQVENDIELEQVENDITLEQVESDSKLEIVENDIELGQVENVFTLEQVENDTELQQDSSDNEIECTTDLQKQYSEDKRDVIDLQDSSDNDAEPEIKIIKNEMVCMICQKRFKDMSYAVLHYNREHAPAGEGLRSYACTECSYTTTSDRIFRCHKKRHKKQKQICDICGNLYASKHALKVHKNTVHKESPQEYKCEQCDRIYRSKSGIENHRRTAHTTTDKQAYCVACKTYFRTAQSLKQHLSTHSRHISESDKRFICDYCGRKFVTKWTLQDHITWEHFRINTHPCTKCSKVYRNPHALNRHVAFVHNKKRPPRDKICDYCGRAFTMQQCLKAHIRTHTGERPLHCSHCPATFAHSAALYNHNRLVHKKKKMNK